MALKQTTNRDRASKSAPALRRCGLPLLVSVLLTALCLCAVRLAPVSFAQDGAQGRGSRPAGVTPKRPRPKAQSAVQSSKKAARANSAEIPKQPSARAQASDALEALSPLLAVADFDLVGLAVTANPPTQTVPKNTPTSVLVSVKVPEGTDPAPIIAGLNPEYRVRGELTGPSLSGPRTIEAAVGEPLPIPPLSQAGEHLLQNLRVVDTGRPEQPVVAPVAPDACGITVIERILVSEVRVNELTYDQIVQAGINISDDSYRAYNFTVGLGTISDARSISIPVAFPSVGVNAPRPVVGTPTVSGPGIDAPTIVPVLLTPTVGGGPDGPPSVDPPMLGEEPVRIPGVVIFPGRVGFLHQFFEAIVIVSNGAPNGAPLVLRNLHAKSRLPDAGTPGYEADDPLRIAETQTGGRVTELDLHGLGADNRYGTADDTLSFRPGEAGQATFLLEGLKDGLHTVDFDLSATLEGLPGGPVQVTGSVPGAVLVRDASFAVTFTHPGIVRAGQEYDLAMTILNTGSRDILGAFARLARNSISGAELLGQDAGERQFPTTILKKDSATIKWRLRASVTGEVTASYVKVGDDISAGLQLVTGVGDRNIPLSPESLILPDPVRHLPPDFVEAARAVLGQGWSIANAPAGSLPAGIIPVTKQSVVDRAVELGLAGMRVDFGEPTGVSIQTLMRDWLGELKQDAGFADALRETPSGNTYYDAIGTEIYKRLTGAGAVSGADYHRELADTESSRSPFVSALVTHADGQPAAGVRLVNATNQRVGFGASAADREVDLENGGALVIGKTDIITKAQTTLGQMALASNVAAENWKLELTGWREGSADLSLLYPGASRTYRHVVFGGVPLTPGGKYRVSFRPLSSLTTMPVLEIFDGTTYAPSNIEGVMVTVEQPAPRLVGAIQVTPSVVAGGDKYGRLVGLLFSKPMLKDQAVSLSKYAVGGGQLKNSDQLVGGPVKVKGASLDYGDRFAFLALDSPIGPYIKREVTVSSMSDARRMALSNAPVTMTINPRVSPEGIPPGAYLTGRVLNADGTPVPGANVIYWTQECPDPSKATLPPEPKPIAVKTTDAQGRYQIDYVRDGDCAPLSVTVANPVTQSEKRLTSPVAYDGQHMVFDMVFLARGSVRGTVTVAGQPVAKAFVNIVPALDVVGTQVVQTDELGRYSAAGVPVGNVSVFAVGTDDLSNSSGFAAGNIDGPNQTAVVNISMQNTGGRVTGRVVRADGNASAGALVVAYARIPAVGSSRADGGTAVGYAYADRDGKFTISKIPVGDVILETTDYVNGMKATQRVTLTTTAPHATNILITLPGLGSISGRVLNETGEPVSKAIVTSGGRGVETDELGNYTLPNMPAGTHGVSAYDPATTQVGSASALVRMGQTTENINIVILRPSTVQGRVMVLEEGQTVPKPVAGAYVSSDGSDLVQTDGQGNYRLPNVTPNAKLTLRVFETKKMLGSNLEIRLAPGETLTRDVTFRPGTVRGRVTQPDGVTGTVADLQVFSPRPNTQPGMQLGLLDASFPVTTRSAADGSYTVVGNNPGAFRVSTSNVFFPTPVSAGGVLAPSGVAECNLSLVSTLAGKIQGRVYRPDGTTPAGAGINVTLGGGSLADATVRTDETGRYEFGEVFSAGGYRLTATDPVTGASNRINVSVQRNQDAIFDLRLLGTGTLRVRVVDGGGVPATSGSVTLDGSTFPNAHRYAEITPQGGGVITFDNLPEGAYAVAATQRGLGGRVAVNVTPDGTVETTIRLQASGTVQGRVLMPGGTAPIGLADVELRVGGRSVGFSVTSDVEGDADATGRFQFLNVPAGDFTLEVFDNRTGRAGRSAGHVGTQDETVTVNVQVFAIGAVAGRVTSNGQPVDHALVEIYADGSGLRSARLKATTDEDGRYRFTGIPAGRFTVTVSGAPGGQGGSVSGVISGTNEPLPDTVADIALEPTQTVTGTVYQLGGTEPLPGSLVTIYVNGSRIYRTNANDAGLYRMSFIPLGTVVVRAEAPSGYDRGEAPAVPGTTAGGTVTSNVTLSGVGRVAGVAKDNNGLPLGVGTVTFVNNDWSSSRLQLTTSVRADGTFDFDDVPAGNFNLKLVVPNRAGTGAAAGVVAGNQTTDVELRLENAGRVTGRVVSETEGVPVAGADVTLTLFRQTGGTLLFYAHSDSQGVFAFENIPLGTGALAVSDETTGGVAKLFGLALAANAQTVDTGDLRLDATPIRVESVTPADGAGDISPSNVTVTVNFSEPSQGVNSGTVRLFKGQAQVSAGVTLSPDARVATLKPAGRLADTSAYTVVVSTSVKDVNGLALAGEFRSSFTTRDESGPAVTGVTPPDGATRLPLTTDVVVTFDEPLDPAQDVSGVVRVTAGSPAEPVAGAVTRAADGRSATFHATAGLVEGLRHTVVVTGQRDALGNVQAGSFTSSFTTLDTTPPVVDPLPIDGTTVRTFRPAITATYRDNASGVQTSSVVLTLDGANVTAGATVTGTGLSYTPAAPLARGEHAVTLRVTDNQGNESEVRTAAFRIDDSGPVITGFTIAGAPAAEGMFVTSTLRPVVAVTYSDDTGVNPAATRVLFGPRGSEPQPVAATVTPTGLTFQPAAPLAEGEYTVEATVVNNLGTSTATPRVNFTLDVDAPEILSLTPSSGSQHGGTTVTMTGQRLLSNSGTDSAGGTGLTGEYFDNIDFTGASLVRRDATVDFDWGTGSPDPSMGVDQFSVRWTGQVQAEFSETYTFYTLSDDGVRLWVNGQQLVNNWTDHAPTENTGVITLVAGQKYDIRMEGYENGGGAVMRLNWSSPSTPRQAIPQARLFPSGTSPQVFVGGAPAVIKSVAAGSPDTVVFTTPAGTPGPASVEVRTDRGRGLLSGGFTYQPDPRTPFSVEPDTAVLWHLDETGNGAVTVRDSAGILTGTASSVSVEQPGRFLGGRSRAAVASISDLDNVLGFGTSSFTAECWVKTTPVNRTYTLVGRNHSSEGSHSYSYGNFLIQLLPSGALRAIVFDTGNRRWQADMPVTAINTTDNEWHAVAMVADRGAGRLSIYVDGVERAAAGIPDSFGPMQSSQLLRAGTIDDSGPQVGGTYSAQFPGTLDEVRVSASAHSPEKMLATYRGTEGTLGLVVLKYGPQSLPRGTTVHMPLTGYNLSGVTASVTDAAGVPQTTRTVTSSATNAVVEIDVSPTAALGATQIVFGSPAGSVSKPVSIVELGQSVYDVEPDTRVLWHLDESGDGVVRINDSGTLSIDGMAGSASRMQEGRFGRGRSYAGLFGDTDFGALNFGTSSFTAECWVKTNPVNRTYTLVGRNHSSEASHSYSYGNFALQLLPSGALRALLFDTGNRRWQAQMAPLGFDVDDNQWHAVAMVVNRETGRLSIYVDGVERASAGIPDSFGPMQSTQLLRAGVIDDSGPQLGGSYSAQFPGTLDEIRISASARPAERLRSDFDGNSGLRVTSFAPSVIKRSKASPEPLVTTIDVLGYDLSNVAARVERDGQPLAVGIELAQSTYRSARLNLTVPSSVPLGTARLVLSKPGQPDAAGDIYISEHSEFAADVDTLVLWHLNEEVAGAARLQDGGPLSIDGTASSASSVAPGHFGKGRVKLGAFGDTDFGALNFGTSSFTAECWVKTTPVSRTYSLVGRNHSSEASHSYSYGNFAIQLLPSGALRAFVFDTGNRRWQADMSQLAADVDDNQWHMVSMVVNREAGRLSLYVDGVERAAAGIPDSFGPMQSTQLLRAGVVDDSGPSDGGTYSAQFPGALDEIRISSTAHTPQRVFNDAVGTDAVRFTWIQPSVLQRGTSDNLVTITGSGLLNSALTVNRPEVTLSSVTTTQTQVTALVSVPPTAAIGPLQFTVTEPNGVSSSGAINVVDQKPFARGTNDNNSTVLLWHLNETGNGAVGIQDSGGNLNGTASSSSAAVPVARFAGGRQKAGITAVTDTAGLLNFGTSSFTAECWVKTPTVSRTYSLVGRNHSSEASHSYSYGNFALQLLPSGALRAFVFDTGNRRWQVDVPKAYSPAAGQWLVSVDDDRWHLLSMVVNREAGLLSLYVDGVERGSAAIPASFGPMQNTQLLRAGVVDDSGPSDGGTYSAQFPGTLDEIRLLRYPRTAAEIQNTWLGSDAAGGTSSVLSSKATAEAARKTIKDGMTVESLTPSLVGRDSSSGKPLVTNVTLKGRGLEGVRAQVLRDGKPAGLNARVESSGDGEALLSVSVEPSAPLGPAMLMVSKPGQDDRWVELRVVEQSEFAVEADTLLLWHMDEPDAGAARLADAGPRSIDATAGASSVALPGRFGGGRARAQAASTGDIRSLPFGRQSFTVEAWMKSAPTERDYVIVGKGSSPGTANDWALKLLASGALRAQLFDTDGRQWAVERQADLPTLSDERWHALTLVVDREAGRLTLYVDGEACAAAEAPADFGEVRGLGHLLLAGHADAEAGPVAAGAEDFPGALDEVRLSSTAHAPEKVALDFFGHDAPEVTHVRPANVPRGAERFAVALFGYALAGATAGAVPEGVRAEVVSSTRTRVELIVSVPASWAPGPLRLGLTDPLARGAAFELNVSEASGVGRGRQKNAPGAVAEAAAPDRRERRPPPRPEPAHRGPVAQPEPTAGASEYSRGGGWRH